MSNPQTTPHPWYGPCDALGPGGRCAECMKDDQGNPQTTARPNAKAIAELAAHYCIQRDPRRTAAVIGEVMAECARRLCEGYIVNGASFECHVTTWEPDERPDLTRADLVNAAAGLIETICLWDLYPRSATNAI